MNVPRRNCNYHAFYAVNIFGVGVAICPRKQTGDKKTTGWGLNLHAEYLQYE